MPRGGKRRNSGRKALYKTAQCLWIVKAVRAELENTKLERLERRLRRTRPKETEAREELQHNQKELRAIPIHKRAAVVADPFGTPLEDVKAIFAENQVSRFLQLPSPSQFDLSAVNERIANAATKQFGKRVSKRQIQRCLSEWNKLQASLDE